VSPRGYAIRLATLAWISTTGAVWIASSLGYAVTGEVHPVLAPILGVWLTVFAVPFTVALSIVAGFAGWVWARCTIRRNRQVVGA
jgi:hypothetical protein